MTIPAPPGAAELKRLCAEYGIRPNRGRGQNFMVDPNSLRLIIDAAEVGPEDIILEPGPGPGGLTQLLAARAAHVVAVELDAKLYSLASERLAHLNNVQLIHADILARDDALNPAALDAVRSARRRHPRASFKIVSNLPYSVGTALIAAALTGQYVPRLIVVTLQKEVAARVCAAPGTSDYGYVTVLIQSLARVQTLRSFSPRVFWPQPRVESALLKITPDPQRRGRVPDTNALKRLAAALFTHRRKQLPRALLLSSLVPTRDDAVRLLREIGADPGDRPETLTLSQFAALAQSLARMSHTPSPEARRTDDAGLR